MCLCFFFVDVDHNKLVRKVTTVSSWHKFIFHVLSRSLFCTGMSSARLCSWAGRQQAWPYWVVPCCAAPAPKKTCEDSNITANHSLPQPGSTCKPHPLPAATQTESRGHAWQPPLHPIVSYRLCLLKWNQKTIVHTHMESCRTHTLTFISTHTFVHLCLKQLQT